MVNHGNAAGCRCFINYKRPTRIEHAPLTRRLFYISFYFGNLFSSSSSSSSSSSAAAAAAAAFSTSVGCPQQQQQQQQQHPDPDPGFIIIMKTKIEKKSKGEELAEGGGRSHWIQKSENGGGLASEKMKNFNSTAANLLQLQQ